MKAFYEKTNAFIRLLKKDSLRQKNENLYTFADLQRIKKCEISDTIFYL